MDRRDFIKSSSAVIGGTFTLVSPSVWAQYHAGSSPDAEPRFNKAMRWAQLAFVETDPRDYDPAFWLDYFKRIHADGALLSAGGIVAFYPTEIPMHHRSDWLDGKDVLGALVKGCRDMGMSVILRTDPHATRQDMYDAHPDYIAVTADGQKRRHWANPDLWVTCALGPYNFDFMTQVTKEIASRYRPDGIFSNRWAGHGVCYCVHCKENFATFSGLELPTSTDRLDPVYQQWNTWRTDRLKELWFLWDGEIRKIDPGSRFIPNGFPDKMITGKYTDFFFADQQARRGMIPPWANARGAKELRAAMGMKRLVGIFSVGIEEEYRWKDSVQSDAEVRIWVAEGVAHGMLPCFVKFSAVLYDKRWVDTVADLYQKYYRSERYLKNIAPLARVGLIYSEQTERYYGGEPWQQQSRDHESGMYHALVEERIPFEMVNDELLDEEHLEPFKLLILPNIAALSDKQCEQIRSFVKRGGSLLATFETSLYDENGNARSDFGLGELFGVSYDGTVEGPMRNSYLRIKAAADTNEFHPVASGLEDAFRIINSVYQVNVEPRGDFPSPVTLIPTYPDLPMEDVYPRVGDTDIRGVYLREVGPSRMAYLPGDIDRSFWQIMSEDHGRLLRNVILWALNEEPLIEVKGPGVVDVALWRQDKSMTAHLVNLTNPMMMKGPFRELLPIAVDATLTVPPNFKATRVKLLLSDNIPTHRVEGNKIIVTVPRLLDHEIIAVDLARA